MRIDPQAPRPRAPISTSGRDEEPDLEHLRAMIQRGEYRIELDRLAARLVESEVP